ncbi:MAG: hypothetical protein P4L76_02435 [Beijerinckiaceae bacterium]|nr:hypothetical protein [Beijerinckiaceae bacterium]
MSDELSSDNAVRLALIAELGALLRDKSQAEHFYTAAAIGSFGALCWGVAALPPDIYKTKFITHPAMAAALNIIIVALLVIIKIKREHTKYASFKISQTDVATALENSLGNRGVIPPPMMIPGKMRGYLYSIIVLAGAALGGVIFCFSILISIPQ